MEPLSEVHRTFVFTLSFLSFFLTAEHVINDSVLWYFAQTLLYAGSVFGIKGYVDYHLKKGK